MDNTLDSTPGAWAAPAPRLKKHHRVDKSGSAPEQGWCIHCSGFSLCSWQCCPYCCCAPPSLGITGFVVIFSFKPNRLQLIGEPQEKIRKPMISISTPNYSTWITGVGGGEIREWGRYGSGGGGRYGSLDRYDDVIAVSSAKSVASTAATSHTDAWSRRLGHNITSIRNMPTLPFRPL